MKKEQRGRARAATVSEPRGDRLPSFLLHDGALSPVRVSFPLTLVPAGLKRMPAANPKSTALVEPQVSAPVPAACRKVGGGK